VILACYPSGADRRQIWCQGCESSAHAPTAQNRPAAFPRNGCVARIGYATGRCAWMEGF
jgi:hypothetical protein